MTGDRRRGSCHDPRDRIRARARSRRRAALAAATGIAALATLALGACSSAQDAQDTAEPTGSPTPDPGPEFPTGAVPAGDPGGWLHDGYAGGIERTWETADEVCGITADSRIALTAGAGDEEQAGITATDLATGEELWTKSPARCGDRAVIGQHAVIAVLIEQEDGTWSAGVQRIEVGSGDATAEAAMPDELAAVELIGEDEERSYLAIHTPGEIVIAAMDRDGEIVWEVPAEEETLARECNVLDGAIGCTGSFDAWIHDAETGEVVHRFEDQSTDLVWAWDGYGIRDDLGPGTAVHDLAGEELAVLPDGAPPMLPAVKDRILFSTDAFVENDAVSVSNAEGEPVAVLDAARDRTRFAASQAAVPGVEGYAGVYLGVTRDGAVLAYSPDVGSDIRIVDDEARELATIRGSSEADGQPGWFTDLEGGLLMSRTAAGTVVHLPKDF